MPTTGPSACQGDLVTKLKAAVELGKSGAEELGNLVQSPKFKLLSSFGDDAYLRASMWNGARTRGRRLVGRANAPLAQTSAGEAEVALSSCAT